MSSASSKSSSPIPTDPTRPAFWGMLIIILGLGGFFAWAAFASIASGAHAPGTLIVESQSKKVQHLKGGIAEAILVEDGDKVSAGDVLIRLKTTQRRAAMEKARAQLQSAKARYARLKAERDGRKAIDFPQGLEQGAGEDPEVTALLQNQRAVLGSRRDAREGQKAVLAERIATQKARIAGLKQQKAAAREQVRIIDEMLEGEESLQAEGFTAQREVLDLQRRRARIQESLAQAETGIAEAKAEIERLRRERGQLDLDHAKQVAEQIQKLQVQIATYREETASAKEQLERAKIRSPDGGEVVGLQLHTEGGVVPPRKTLMEIVPGKERLVIEARVQPSDIDRVETGQEAEVRFTSLSTRSTAVILGEVQKVSADRLQDPDKEEAYYSATVTVSRDELAKLEGQRLVPGMPVDVIIQAGSRTPLDYLLKPITDSLAVSFLE